MVELLVSALVAGVMVLPKDTLIDVREGDRLFLSDFSGSVVVEAWDRTELMLETDRSRSTFFEVNRTGTRVEVRVVDRKGRNRAGELRVFLPVWMDIDLSGRDLEAWILDVGGAVRIRNLEGDITLRNLAGSVDVHTLEGSLRASGLSGNARLRTGDDDLWVGRSSADLELETVDGEITLEGLESPRVSVKTTEGDVDFAGRLLPQGDYAFVSHGGDLRFALVPPVDLDVTVLVYDGDFESDFPVKAKGYRSGGEISFALGAGGGRLMVEAFNGDVELRRLSNRR